MRKTYRLGFMLVVLSLIAVVSYVAHHNIYWTNRVPGPQKVFKGPDQRPSQWFWLQRTFPYDNADPDAYTAAITATRSLRKTSNTSNLLWEFAGPENIGGRIVDIEFNPQNPDIVYAGAATGGVFRSDDGGFSWIPVFDDQVVLSIGDIAVDPLNPEIVYVGTGEANGGHNNFPGGGIYKSIDGGSSWTYMGLESTRSIGRVLVNPKNSAQVFIAAVGSYFGPDPHRGVYVSNDGGLSWEKSLFISDSTGAIDLIMDPENPSFMMAAMWERVRRPVALSGTHLYGATSGIYRSWNGGVDWEYLGPDNGLPDPVKTRIGRIGLGLYPQNADSIYAVYTDGSDIAGLYFSSDRGTSWEQKDVTEELRQGTGGFSWYFGQIRVKPKHPDVVYVLDVAFMRSEDGGQSFPLKDGYGNNKNLHVDHHALAFHPQNPDYIIDGNDGGINISNDGGDTWTKVAALPVTQFYEIGLDPQNPERLYGGTQDNGTMRTVDGYLDDWEIFLGGDGFYVIVDPEDPNLIYAESQFGNLYKIDNGEYTFLLNEQMHNDRKNWSAPVVMDPNDNQVLYYGATRIYRSEDAGASWEAISGDLSRQLPDSRVGTITTISVAPTNSDVIYAGTDDGLIWVSDDFGDFWEEISGDLPFRWVTRVVADPHDETIVYATFSGLKWKEAQPHVFRGTDMGTNWTNISSNLPDAPVNAFAIDPRGNGNIYCGTDVGVFFSSDSGKSWSSLGSGLPVVVINDMKINEDTDELIVGTHGRSMYRFDLSALTVLDEDEPKVHTPAGFELGQNFPNPFNNTTRIPLHIYEPGSVQILIFDATGREVARINVEGQQYGYKTVTWAAGREIASGIYFYRASQSGRGVTGGLKKMVLLK